MLDFVSKGHYHYGIIWLSRR